MVETLKKFQTLVARRARSKKHKDDPRISAAQKLLGLLSPIERKERAKESSVSVVRELKRRKKAFEAIEPGVQAASRLFGVPVTTGVKAPEPPEVDKELLDPLVSGAQRVARDVLGAEPPEPTVRTRISAKPGPGPQGVDTRRFKTTDKSKKAFGELVRRQHSKGELSTTGLAKAFRSAYVNTTRARRAVGGTAQTEKEFLDGMMVELSDDPVIQDVLKRSWMDEQDRPLKAFADAARISLVETGLDQMLAGLSKDQEDVFLTSMGESILDDFYNRKFDSYAPWQKKLYLPVLEKLGAYKLDDDSTIEDEIGGKKPKRYGPGQRVLLGSAGVRRATKGGVGGAITDLVTSAGRGIYRSLPVTATGYTPGYFDMSDLGGTQSFLSTLREDTKRITKRSRDSLPLNFVKNTGELVEGMALLAVEVYKLLGDDAPEVVKQAVISDLKSRNQIRPLTSRELELMTEGRKAESVRNLVQSGAAGFYNMLPGVNFKKAFQSDPLFVAMTFTGALRAPGKVPGMRKVLSKVTKKAPNKPWVPEHMRGKEVPILDLIDVMTNKVDSALLFGPVKTAASAVAKAPVVKDLVVPAVSQLAAAIGPAARFVKDAFITPQGKGTRVARELEGATDVAQAYKADIDKFLDSIKDGVDARYVMVDGPEGPVKSLVQTSDSVLIEKMNDLDDAPKEALAEVVLKELGLTERIEAGRAKGGSFYRELVDVYKRVEEPDLGEQPKSPVDPKNLPEIAARTEVESLTKRLDDADVSPTRKESAAGVGLDNLGLSELRQQVLEEGGSLKDALLKNIVEVAKEKGYQEVNRLLRGGDDPLSDSFARRVARRSGATQKVLEGLIDETPEAEAPVATTAPEPLAPPVPEATPTVAPSPATAPRVVSPVARRDTPETPVATATPEPPVARAPEETGPAPLPVEGAPALPKAEPSAPTSVVSVADDAYFAEVMGSVQEIKPGDKGGLIATQVDDLYPAYVEKLSDQGGGPHAVTVQGSAATEPLLAQLKKAQEEMVRKDIMDSIESALPGLEIKWAEQGLSPSEIQAKKGRYIKKRLKSELSSRVKKDMEQAQGALHQEVLDAEGGVQYEGRRGKPGSPKYVKGRPVVDRDAISQSDIPVMILDEGVLRAEPVHTSRYGAMLDPTTGAPRKGVNPARQSIAHVIAGLESGKPFQVAASSPETVRYLQSLARKPSTPAGGLGAVTSSDGLIGALVKGRERTAEAKKKAAAWLFGDETTNVITPEVTALVKDPKTRDRGVAQIIQEAEVVNSRLVNAERRALLQRELDNSQGAIKGEFDGEVTAATDDTLGGKSAEELGLMPATQRQKEWFGLDEEQNLYLQPETQKAINWDLFWRAQVERFGRPGGFVRSLSSAWKRMMTAANPVTFVGNYVSNLALRALVNGKISPMGMIEATGLYNKYKKGLLDKNSFEYRMIRDWERKGWGDFTSAEIKKALSEGITDKFGRWLSENRDTEFARAVSKIMQGTGSGADSALVTRILSRGLSGYKGLLNKLEGAYQTSDIWFKIEQGLEMARLLDESIGELAEGASLTFDVSPDRGVTLYKKDGQVLLGGPNGRKLKPPEIDSLLSEAGKLAGNRLFFDYNKIPNYMRGLRSIGADIWMSPFYSWFYKAMWIPGMKEGLGKHILTGGLSGIKSTDPRVLAKIKDKKAREALGRLSVVTSAHATSQVPGRDKESVLNLLSGYGKGKESPFIGIIDPSDPMELRRFLMSRFDVSGAQLPLFRMLGSFIDSAAGKDPGGSTLSGTVDDFIIPGRENHRVLNEVASRAAKGSSKDPSPERRAILKAVRDMMDPAEREKYVRLVRDALPSRGLGSSDLRMILGMQRGGAGPLIADLSGEGNTEYLLPQLIGLATGSKGVGDIITKTLKQGKSIKEALREHAGLRSSSLASREETAVNNYITKQLKGYEKAWTKALERRPSNVNNVREILDAKTHNKKVAMVISAEMQMLRSRLVSELADLGYAVKRSGTVGQIYTVPAPSPFARREQARKEIKARIKARAKKRKRASR